jgi:hypothetical protein
VPAFGAIPPTVAISPPYANIKSLVSILNKMKKKDILRAQTMSDASFVHEKKRCTWGPNIASGIICAHFYCRCPTVAIVICCYTHRLFINRKEKKEKRKDTNMVVVKTGQQLCRLLGQWVGSHLIGSMM